MKLLSTVYILGLVLALSACSSSPVEKMKAELDAYPEYTVILDDMKEEGLLFKDFYHRYKIVYAEPAPGNRDSLIYNTRKTDWQEVNESYFRESEPYLGMALASRMPGGETINTEYPPGYQYVGNERYGQWRTDASGNSFWEFYGKYAFMRSMFSLFSSPVYRSDYDTYRGWDRRSPYFGRNQEFGTYGSRTKASRPDFFQRRQAREMQRKSSFGEKVQQRNRRSNMSGTRSRSRGFGK